MNTKLFGLAAAVAVSMALLTGCPAEEKKSTTTETTTATGAASPESAATAEGTATHSTTTTTTTSTTTEHASPDAHGGTMAASPAGGTMAASPAASAGTTTTAAANVDAKSIFSQKCAGCHGANGGGGMGPALGNVEAKGDAHIKNRIINGSPEKGMPAFGQQLSAAEVDALVAYTKSL